MTKYTDREVWDGIRFSNNKILNYIIDKYFPRIEYYVTRNNGSSLDAEDIFQEGLITVYRKLHNNDFVIQCSFFTFLYSICRLLWLKELRNRKEDEVIYEKDLVDEVGINIIEDQLKNERKKLFRKYLNLISEECKKFIIYCTKGYTLAETTELMGYNNVNVSKSKKYKCKKELIEKIRTSPKFKELKNERLCDINEIPRR